MCSVYLLKQCCSVLDPGASLSSPLCFSVSLLTRHAWQDLVSFLTWCLYVWGKLTSIHLSLSKPSAWPTLIEWNTLSVWIPISKTNDINWANRSCSFYSNETAVSKSVSYKIKMLSTSLFKVSHSYNLTKWTLTLSHKKNTD